MPTWNAGQYLKFADERTRPCRELAARVSVESAGRIIDLGCGPGNSTAVLLERWPGARLTGLDNSPQMIESARKALPNLQWLVSDIAAWVSSNTEPFDVLFSNAALQWVGNHADLYPRLLKHVAPGGALAVQVPINFDSPAHTAMRELAATEVWRPRFPNGVREWHVHSASFYYDAVAPLCRRVDMWETEYFHVMPDAGAIVEWYKGTGLRPFLDALADDQQRRDFTAGYLQRIAAAYPTRADGRIVFPFRRLFLIAYPS